MNRNDLAQEAMVIRLYPWKSQLSEKGPIIQLIPGFRMAFRANSRRGGLYQVISVASGKTKFMQMLDSQAYRFLEKEARNRGASIQELLRAVIIPDWLMENRRREKI